MNVHQLMDLAQWEHAQMLASALFLLLTTAGHIANHDMLRYQNLHKIKSPFKKGAFYFIL